MVSLSNRSHVARRFTHAGRVTKLDGATLVVCLYLEHPDAIFQLLGN